MSRMHGAAAGGHFSSIFSQDQSRAKRRGDHGGGRIGLFLSSAEKSHLALRRLRPVYRRRRDSLLAALARRLPELEPVGISAGLHLVTWLPPHLDEAEVVKAAFQAGVGIDGVRPYRIEPGEPGGLIFGFATVNEPAIVEGIDILARTVRRL